MDHQDFQIGTEFMTETGRWRCTDVGTRTIVAIKLDPGRSSDWQNGPPYAVAETVFDEDDFPACGLAEANSLSPRAGRGLG